MKRLALISAAGLLVASSAAAQQYGQWTWDASLGAVQRSWQDSRAGVETEDRNENEAALSLGVDGFVLSPVIAPFRLGISGHVNNADASLNTRQMGYDARIRILPLSYYPLELFASKSTYDYSANNSDPAFFTGTPDTATTLGGRLRLRRGLLGGTLLGFEQTAVSYIEGGDESLEREFAEWSGQSGKIQHNFNAEHRYWDVGRSGYAYDDYSVVSNERGPISERWNWDFNATAFQRGYIYGGDTVSTTDLANLFTQFNRTSVTGNTLSLVYSGGLNGDDTGIGLTSHRVEARYQHSLGVRTSITPYAAYGLQSAPAEDLRVAEFGVSAAWGHAAGGFDTSFSGGVGYQQPRVSSSSATSTATQLSYSAGAAVSHGSDSTLREQLDFSYTKNDLTMAGRPTGDFPDYGAAFFGAGFEDNQSARLTLSKRIAAVSVDTWVDYRSTRTSPVSMEQLEIKDLVYSLQITSRDIGFTASGGSTEVLDGTDQMIDFVSGSAFYRPTRSLQFNAMYRSDVRQMQDGPDRDATRIEAGAQFQMGLLVLGVSYFDSSFVDDAGIETSNKGLTATIRRTFGGTLPVVSAPVRRGTIR
jgi:hypothetical protein